MTGFFPGRPAIDVYGGGGFGFAGMSHKGSILALPSGVYAWGPSQPLTVADFTGVFNERASLDLLILGTGEAMTPPPREVRRAFSERGLMMDFMITASAVTTYNLLLGEKRRVAAALVAVERPA
ncbi:Mth938-like domain-containing protein [Aestuariivirga sp.]|uniref:Mth938-like domain-containing protein n=1 Tax=Aestuariivirga sp. TaxID=2650926 RepID=UPI0039E35C2B